MSRTRSLLILFAVLVAGLAVWVFARSGDDGTVNAEPGQADRADRGPRLPSALPGPTTRPGKATDAAAVIRALVGAVGRDADLGVRLIALNELAALGYPAVVPALAGIANDQALPVRVRRQALLLLAGKPGEVALDTMVSMLQSDEEDLRLAAAQGLGILGHAEGFAALNEAFLVEPSTGVAKAIVQSMARIGTPEAVEALLDHSAPDNLPTDMNRDAVLGALAGIANPAGVPALTAALVESTDTESRRALVRSLARVADPTSFDHFLDIAQSDPDHETRCQAMQGLGMIGDPLALETLRAIESSTEDTREQSYARTAIQRIEGRP